MAHEWIRARDALRFVATASNDYDARMAICRRAFNGALAAKAGRFLSSLGEKSEWLLPKSFWWAEGHNALEQDWSAGDFSTIFERDQYLRAFDVSFDFIALNEMVPAAQRPAAMQSISVSGDQDWMPARDLHGQAFGQYGPTVAARAILEQCRIGQVVGRAIRMTMMHGGKPSPSDPASLEWDIPLWFWREFTDFNASSQDWQTGRFSGRGELNGTRPIVTLQGVHFHRASLVTLGIMKPDASGASTATEQVKGRPASKFWDELHVAILGQIYRAELIPEHQSDIEAAMQNWLVARGESAAVSTVRKRARLIFAELNREGEKPSV